MINDKTKERLLNPLVRQRVQRLSHLRECSLCAWLFIYSSGGLFLVVRVRLDVFNLFNVYGNILSGFAMVLNGLRVDRVLVFVSIVRDAWPLRVRRVGWCPRPSWGVLGHLQLCVLLLEIWSTFSHGRLRELTYSFRFAFLHF